MGVCFLIFKNRILKKNIKEIFVSDVIKFKGKEKSLTEFKRFSAGGKQNVNLCKYKR